MLFFIILEQQTCCWCPEAIWCKGSTRLLNLQNIAILKKGEIFCKTWCVHSKCCLTVSKTSTFYKCILDSMQFDKILQNLQNALKNLESIKALYSFNIQSKYFKSWWANQSAEKLNVHDQQKVTKGSYN